MNQQLEPAVLTIRELFAGADASYMVPIYQRNYAWQAEQIEQLLADIQDAIRDGKAGYFLGNLVVTKSERAGSCFEVIDGQQRLTTLYLLLTLLAERGLAGPDHQGRLRYESRPRATEALRHVSTASSAQSAASTQSSLTEDAAIHRGFNIIQQYVDQHVGGRDAQAEFTGFLLDQVSVVRASLPAGTDFNRYFEIMNTRGQQLHQADIVKARLMQHLEHADHLACFAWIWEACADMDSYVQMSLTRDDPALRTAVFGNDWSRLPSRDFDGLVKIRSGSDASPDAGLGLNAPLTLDEALMKYAGARTPESSEDQNNVRFRSPVEFPAFLLHVLRVVEGDTSEDEGRLDDKALIKRFADFLDRATEKARCVQDFALSLLQCRHLFDSYVLKRQYTATNADEGEWSLQRLVKRGSDSRPVADYINTFSRGRNDAGTADNGEPASTELLVLQSMLRVTYTSPRTMHWISLLLAVLAADQTGTISEADLCKLLRDYARSKIRRSFPLGENAPTGFSIGRIVFTYLDYLLWTEKKSPGFRFSFRNSIEHFYPQHPDEQQSGDKVSEECLHLLGNLALVSVGANSKFSNSLPKAKAENFRTTIEMQSPKLHRMAELARGASKWGDDEVRAHHEEMMDLLRCDLARQESATGQ